MNTEQENHPSSTVMSFLSAMRDCAIDMMSNAQYVREQLPTLQLPHDLRAGISELCDLWIGTKHDVISELYEMQPFGDSPVMETRCNRLASWISDDTRRADAVFRSLGDAMSIEGSSHDIGLAWMLVIESATNVLNSHGRMLDMRPANWRNS